jgi:ribosome biogenesis GTPase
LETGAEQRGIIIRGYGLHYDVSTPAGLVRCTLRGTIKRERRKTDPAAVGDHVRLTVTDLEENPPAGVIEEIEPRVRSLSRLARGTDDVEQVILANPDQLLTVFAAREPNPSPRMIDRFLLIAEARELDAAICINKLDIDTDNVAERLAERFEGARYPVFTTSVATGAGVPELRRFLQGKVTALAGPSGVGKSSLINLLVPGLEEITGHVSAATGKGRHTTSWTTLFQIGDNTFIADTPGMRQLGLWGIDFDHLDELFPEFRPYLGECRYGDCSHTHEPGCAVRAALDAGTINRDRYESYVALLGGDED